MGGESISPFGVEENHGWDNTRRKIKRAIMTLFARVPFEVKLFLINKNKIKGKEKKG